MRFLGLSYLIAWLIHGQGRLRPFKRRIGLENSRQKKCGR
jgi:hypothetical protein